ncbi:MAG: MATE family efflux transporter [Spirochaetaceae bacterium]|jgi:putative MATE family efflux protein|nr:MATE family efflux transporter [Spirochaetaceae bacterium]
MNPKLFGPLSFYKHALGIALPVMAQVMIQSLVSLIDNFMVAGLGDVAMAAVNVTNQLNFVYIVIENAMCAAGGIYIAQYCGAKNNEGMQNAYRFKVIFGSIVGLVYFALCWLIPDKMIEIMTMGNAAQDEIVEKAVPYMRICSFTLVPMVLSNAIGGSYREMGRPKIPLVISVCSTVVNTIGNIFLIYGVLGAPRLEVTGAAISTVIARFVEIGSFIVYARHTKAEFYVPFLKIFHRPKGFFRRIFANSVMMMMSELSWVVSETVMTALYNGRGGAETVAGMAAGFSIANIFFMVFGGVWTASAVVIGGSLGAGKLDEARKRSDWLHGGSIILGLVIALGGALLSLVIIPIVFANLSDDARQICFGLVMVILAYLPFQTLLNVLFAVTRAGGDTATGMYADVSVNTLIFIPGAFLLAFLTPLGPVEMYIILKLADIGKFFIAKHFMNKERWVKNLTLPSNS